MNVCFLFSDFITFTHLKKHIILTLRHYFLVVILCFSQTLFGQYPHYFTYDDENGLPSNEVYCIEQDKNGFIWFGSEAGLFRYDGVRYTHFKSPTQKANAFTGLTISQTGKIYGYNFQNQLFILENDELIEIKSDLKKISSMCAGDGAKIWVTHENGVSCYEVITKKWTTYTQYGRKNKFHPEAFSTSVISTGFNEISFLHSWGVGSIKNKKLGNLSIPLFNSQPSGRFSLVKLKDRILVFSTDGNSIFQIKNDQFIPYQDEQLSKILKGKKITRLKFLSDQKLWICTYNGVIKYDVNSKSVEHFYPDISFSDVMLDRENNYWFTTLQTGIIRVPNFDFLVWNKQSNKLFNNDKLTQIELGDDVVYFATVNGFIGELNKFSNEIKLYHIGNNADVQSLEYISSEKSLYFYIGENMYRLQNGRTSIVAEKIAPTKAILNTGNIFLLGTSAGISSHRFNQKWTGERLFKTWTREFVQVNENTVYAATNCGLIRLQRSKSEWKVIDTLLSGQQIQSLSFQNGVTYCITFEGKVYKFDKSLKINYLSKIPINALIYKIKTSQNTAYVATNKGVFYYNLDSKQWNVIDRLSGLASDNVQDFAIDNNTLWIACGKGLQSIKINRELRKYKSHVYLMKNEKSSKLFYAPLDLDYGEKLILYPKASTYSSQGNFEFAYRINGGDWIKLPGSIQKIVIANPPLGKMRIEIKAIDHLGKDSENTIVLTGFVDFPFWQKWWFIGLMLILFIIATLLFVRHRIKKIKQREEDKTMLVKSQLTALKAQMNPHFMYNALNSIQALILKEDTKNSNLYLSKFSHLMRKVLTVSGEEEVSIHEEMEILELYLSLEKLRFGADFEYKIELDPSIDNFNNFIPPLLLQPFVENAIKHGLLHKTGQKSLIISTKEEQQQLLISIRDNGVGRSKSMEINSRQHEKHQSFSTNATQKRIDLFNLYHPSKIQLLIIDHSIFGESTGTEVQLRIDKENVS